MITYPDKFLLKTSKPIENITDETQEMIQEMKQQMFQYHGVGIAAVQVGYLLQCIIVKDEVMINPTIIETSKDTDKMIEGCLSIPGVIASIKRPKEISVKYINEKGQKCFMNAQSFEARIIQHELDHLNGKLFIHHMSRTKREKLLRNFKNSLTHSE